MRKATIALCALSIMLIAAPAAQAYPGNYFDNQGGEIWNQSNQILMKFTEDDWDVLSATREDYARWAILEGFEAWDVADDDATYPQLIAYLGAKVTDWPAWNKMQAFPGHQEFCNNVAVDHFPNSIHWENMGSGANAPLARTYQCDLVGDAKTDWAVIVFNKAYDDSNNWHLNPGNSGPSGTEWDMWSVAAHEGGHILGFDAGPYGDGHLACTTPRPTMCGNINKGDTSQRSLTTDDTGEYQDHY